MGIVNLYIAKAAALATNATMEGFPTDGLTIAAREAPVVAWALAEGVALTLEGLNAVEAECLGARFEDFVRDNLDAKISTRATQSSVNFIQTSVNTVQTSVNELQSSVNNGITGIQVNLAAIGTNIRNVQTSINTLQTSVNAFQELDLRLKIEANLALNFEGAPTPVGSPGRTIALSYLPAAQGGYLPLARIIVEETTRKTMATGQPVGIAVSRLASADEAIAAGQFKEAYRFLGQAYREATQSH